MTVPARWPIQPASLRLPVIAAPMFIVSTPALVIAQCRTGILGSLPALNARPAAQLDDWLAEIDAALADPAAPGGRLPYAVNLIVHRSNERLEQDLAVLERHRVPLVITSLGARPEVNQAVHGWGGVVMHDVIHDAFARKAIDKGADGLIAVAAGAGGHAGTLSPFALLSEIRRWFDGPLALSGSLATGGAILAAQAAGADFAYIGSPFIATDEARATPAYKQCIVDSASADIVYTDLFTGVHGNYLKASVRAAGLDPEALPRSDPSRMDFGGDTAAKAWKDIWGCGQGIGVVDRVQPVAALVTRWADEYAETRARLRV
ncbi:MAG: hypothetical protein RIQ53_2517 [Pseudomonadota bacterium]|jgi:nitronate monooxygenase